MQIEKIEFSYHIRRSARRKTVSICVYPDNRVVIAAPPNFSQKNISLIVEKKSDWIRKRIQNNLEKIQKEPRQRLYSNGERLLYLGTEYALRVERGLPGLVSIKDGCIRVELNFDENGEPEPSAVRTRLMRWYAACALEKIKQRVKHYQERIGATPRFVTLKTMRSRWGSCSAQGRISLAWNIIMAPEEIIDYLIVHELCHLIHLNHSAQYWDLVASIIPDHRQKRKWLLKNGNLLRL